MRRNPHSVEPFGAVAAATWFESLAVASRLLQRRLAETIFTLVSFTKANGENDSQLLVQQSIGAACTVKRCLRLLAQQSLKAERSQNRIRRTRGEAGTLG
jgi:hypothetical protein